MKLGITLPTALGPSITGRTVLDSAKMADQGGFALLGVTDRPNYDSWEPIVTLAGVAAVTTRIRLATTVILLPTRNPTLLAKQAAIVDQLSDGRLILGVGQGSRADDYQVLDSNFADRTARFRLAIDRVKEVWRDSQRATPAQGSLGPPPYQTPGPPVWIGAVAEKALERAIEAGDGILLAALPLERVKSVVPHLRAAARVQGRPRLLIGACALVAIGKRRAPIVAEARRNIRRYYGPAAASIESRVHHGSASAIAEVVAQYAEAKLDLLVLMPQIGRVDQITQLVDSLEPSRFGSLDISWH